MHSLTARLQPFAESAIVRGGWFGVRAIGAPKRIVFVCTGNICRSPFAEAYARSRGLDARSVGIDTTSDRPAHPMAITEASRRNIDLSAHRTTRWQEIDVSAEELIVAAELKHALAVRQKAATSGARVVLMSGLLMPDFQIVRDPYGRDETAFVTAFDLIERVVSQLEQQSRR